MPARVRCKDSASEHLTPPLFFPAAGRIPQTFFTDFALGISGARFGSLVRRLPHTDARGARHVLRQCRAPL